MPLEAKPLFRPDVIFPLLAKFQLPARAEQCRDRLAQWASNIETGKIDGLKEREILPDFLTLFCDLLGYTGPVGGTDFYTFSREKHVQVDGEYADAVIGRFTAEKSQFIVALEGKGPKDPLQRPHAGRRLSAVDQAYRYAINLPCDWIIVTNIREIRLYFKGADQQTYEIFETVRLVKDPLHLKKLIFLLGAERVVPERGPCHFVELLAHSERAGQEITKTFYVQYADMRQDVFQKLREANPDAPGPEMLTATQKLLDRVLFVAFCEDRALLPSESLKRAYEHADPYNPRPIWENFCGLFRAINKGNAKLKIPGYNGGLFADDPKLDALNIPDSVCEHFRNLGEYDYRATNVIVDSLAPSGAGMVDVDLLGHIFEQSITDLERLRGAIQPVSGGEPESFEKLKSRRKHDGAFYTPKFITRYIVSQTLGATLRERFELVRQKHAEKSQGTAKAALEDPAAYDLEKLNKPQRDSLRQFFEAWQAELETIKIVDPACGSGAFLIEAFDQMLLQYQTCNERLEELRGSRTLFDPDRTILEKNLYGVDLNEEAIEICRLSLWIKTAQPGKVLTSLDHNVRCGNSLIADKNVHDRAFEWQAVFPEVFGAGGFDVVIGNPPYVRQELLSAIKPYLEKHYQSFHGMADLYVYFYELGLNLLKPGGRLSFIVTNKWLKAGYAEALRKVFAEQAWMESVVDFGHAKQIFEDADVFPCIIVARKPQQTPEPKDTRVCVIPREQLRITDLANQIESEGFLMPRASLNAAAWEIEPPEVAGLLKKIRHSGVPLTQFAGVKPYRGVLTGFNAAFLIDTATKERLVKAHPNCAEVIKPYLRGQDVDRWRPVWEGLWMIVLKSSENHPWLWAETGAEAEAVFQRTYPSLHAHMKQYEPQLQPRQDQGRYWWELRSCAYYSGFERPKVMYQEIQFHPCYCLDEAGTYSNNKTFFLATDDLYLLCVLNSPLMWWHNWRYLPHMKDEALSPMGFKMETLPIARPTDEVRAATQKAATMLLALTKQQRTSFRDLLDWLRIEHTVEKPSIKLQNPVGLDTDTFVAEVKKARGKAKSLTPAALKSLRDAYTDQIEPARARAHEAQILEAKISDLVNAAYGLTPAEVKLMWRTAPPRMPYARNSNELS